MRDLDESNSGKKNRNENHYFNIEPDIGPMDTDDQENDFEDHLEEHLSETSRRAFKEFEKASRPHKIPALSSLSKRTLLVSVIILIGFIGIFIWPWIFEVFGFLPLNGSSPQSAQQQVTEIMTLPSQDSNRSTIALAPSPVESHARAPKVQEELPNPNPISETTHSAQGISMGSTHTQTPIQNTVASPESPLTPESAQQQPNPQDPHTKPLPDNKIPIPNPRTEPRSELHTPAVRSPAVLPKSAASKPETLLLNRSQDHYTIQILAMQDEQKLKAFINQSILKNKMSFYSTVREGKPWYVVIYGDFETKQQAESALFTLPLDIQKNKPWVKSMRDVQGAIRAKS